MSSIQQAKAQVRANLEQAKSEKSLDTSGDQTQQVQLSLQSIDGPANKNQQIQSAVNNAKAAHDQGNTSAYDFWSSVAGSLMGGTPSPASTAVQKTLGNVDPTTILP